MATWETICDIASVLPGSKLDADGDSPAWRVNGWVIARSNPRLDVLDEDELRRQHGEVAAIGVDWDERNALLGEMPEMLFTTPLWESSPMVLVWLAGVDDETLRDLMTRAGRKRLWTRA